MIFDLNLDLFPQSVLPEHYPGTDGLQLMQGKPKNPTMVDLMTSSQGYHRKAMIKE